MIAITETGKILPGSSDEIMGWSIEQSYGQQKCCWSSGPMVKIRVQNPSKKKSVSRQI